MLQRCDGSGVKTLPQLGCVGKQGSVAPAGWQQGKDFVSRVGWVLEYHLSLAATPGVVDFSQ